MHLVGLLGQRVSPTNKSGHVKNYSV